MKKLNKSQIICVIGLLTLFLLMVCDYAFAASQSEILFNAGTGINSKFDAKLSEIGNLFLIAAKFIIIILTATAAIMVGFGIEDGKKTLWNWILGTGLAINFGWFIINSGLYEYALSYQSTTTAVTTQMPTLIEGDKSLEVGKAESDILSNFFAHYRDGIIKPGVAAIMPGCLKLLLIVTLIEATWELAFKLTSGDKVKFLLSIAIKCGFFMFLMTNWIDYMDALSNGFQSIGFTAGGATLEEGEKLNPDSIWKNAFALFDAWYAKANGLKIGTFIISGIGLLGTLFVAVLTAFEMFMARIEFFTMALLTIPLLPFAITSKFGFLADKAIGAMINLSIKLCVIAFITSMSVPFLGSFMEKAKTTEGFGDNLSLILQTLMAACLIYLLVKKIPDLVTGLLSGQPSLSGASMMDTLKSAANTGMSLAGAAAGGVAGAAVQAANIANNGGGIKGALLSLGKSGLKGGGETALAMAKTIALNPLGITNMAKSAKDSATRQFSRYNGETSPQKIDLKEAQSALANLGKVNLDKN